MAKSKKNQEAQEHWYAVLRKDFAQMRKNPRGFCLNIWQKLRAVNYKNWSVLDSLIKILQKIKKIKWRNLAIAKQLRRLWKKISQSWRVLIVSLVLFLFSYYSIGAFLAENMDVATEYKLENEQSPMFETAGSMSFLLKREVDDKMWTPNLPIVFPAYVLDNMPNFQIGIVTAVKDVSEILRELSQNTKAQQKDIKQAVKLLQYSPRVWLLSRQGKFNLAPSSNSQYRKAAHLLQQYRSDGVFTANRDDLQMILQQIVQKLLKQSDKNAERQREHSRDFFDVYCDDLFYYNRGYAFALWQISKVLGTDYKAVILHSQAYNDWTYYISSLKKAAEFKPLVVCNGEPQALFAANHLLVQNYYLLRAAAFAERVCNDLLKEEYAD